MKPTKKTLLAAGLLIGSALMSGCSATTTPVSTPTPQPKVTAQPASAEPTTQPTAEVSPEASGTPDMEGGEETPAPLSLTVDGETLSTQAVREQDKLLLPLEETAQALGWKAKREETEDGTQTKRVITLDKGDSRITVSWTVSDNTAKNISWQKDGLLIPVDTHITTVKETVYVPAAFFEEAMDAAVSEGENGVTVDKPAPKDTPETGEQTGAENG